MTNDTSNQSPFHAAIESVGALCEKAVELIGSFFQSAGTAASGIGASISGGFAGAKSSMGNFFGHGSKHGHGPSRLKGSDSGPAQGRKLGRNAQAPAPAPQAHAIPRTMDKAIGRSGMNIFSGQDLSYIGGDVNLQPAGIGSPISRDSGLLGR